MTHRELPFAKLQVPRGVRLSSKSHPLDTGFERLLNGPALTKILPDWIIDQRQPTPTEWESATWLAEVVRHHNRPGTLNRATPPAWTSVIHEWPMGDKFVVTNDNYPHGMDIKTA